jgi:hypothetical protein
MARYSAEVTTGAGSTTLPIISLYASASGRLVVREVGVFNTTTTAPTVGLKLVRLTSTGTQGAAITVNKYNPDDAAATGTPRTTHTVAPGLGTDIAAMPVGAAIGAGTILTFYGENNGLHIASGTGNGIGILPLGTGAVCTAYIIWDE